MIGGRPAGWLSGAALALLATGAAHAAGADGGHADPFAPILLELAVVVLAAALGRRAAGLVGQPAVLGELCIGVVIGNVGYWLGAPLFVLLMHLDDVGKIVAMAWNSPLTVADAAAKVFPATQLGPGTVGARVVEALGGREGGQWAVMTLVIRRPIRAHLRHLANTVGAPSAARSWPFELRGEATRRGLRQSEGSPADLLSSRLAANGGRSTRTAGRRLASGPFSAASYDSTADAPE